MFVTIASLANRLAGCHAPSGILIVFAMGLATWMLEPHPSLGAQPPLAQGVPSQSPPSTSTADTPSLRSSAPASVAPASVAPASVAPASVAPASVAPASVAPASSVQLNDQPPPRFVRLLEQAGQPTALQLAIITYTSPSPGGAQVDLISAVHIGEKAYYAELNQLFRRYDVVLYELVAPAGTELPAVGQQSTSKHPIAWLQDVARGALGLESQLAKIDYHQPQMLRADLTTEQLVANMQARGDTPLTLALSTLVEVMRQQNLAAQGTSATPAGWDAADLDIEELLAQPVKLKQLLARQLASSGSLDQALGGSLNQLLVIDRNAAALKGLQQQLAAGKQRIGIFYGAAHMPDFHQHLVKDFGLRPKEVRWLTAWNLKQSSLPSLSNPSSLLWRLLEVLPE